MMVDIYRVEQESGVVLARPLKTKGISLTSQASAVLTPMLLHKMVGIVNQTAE